MTIGELARRVGRSTETLRRWEAEGLLVSSRDHLGKRVYREHHIERALLLAEAGPSAQRRARKMSVVINDLPGTQLSLFSEQS
jgi:predicted site-specific integrase-resolvase